MFPLSVHHRDTVLAKSLFVLATTLATLVFPPGGESLENNFDTDITGKVKLKIIGGNVAERGSTPWLVSLKDLRFHHNPVLFCGGSIISSHWVLTAAHCIIGYDHPTNDVEVVVGDYDLDHEDECEKKKYISEVIVHPNYDYFTREFDVALLRVNSPIKFNKMVRPLPLSTHQSRTSTSTRVNHVPVAESGNSREDSAAPSDVSDNHYDPCTHKDPSTFHYQGSHLGYIAGWGSTVDRMPHVSLVHDAYLPIIDKELCHAIYRGLFTDNMMCAGNLTHGGVDPCNGDWGGPLVDSHGYLRGVASWSLGCGRAGFPAVYVDIHSVQDWVCRTIDD